MLMKVNLEFVLTLLNMVVSIRYNKSVISLTSPQYNEGWQRCYYYTASGLMWTSWQFELWWAFLYHNTEQCVSASGRVRQRRVTARSYRAHTNARLQTKPTVDCNDLKKESKRAKHKVPRIHKHYNSRGETTVNYSFGYTRTDQCDSNCKGRCYLENAVECCEKWSPDWFRTMMLIEVGIIHKCYLCKSM